MYFMRLPLVVLSLIFLSVVNTMAAPLPEYAPSSSGASLTRRERQLSLRALSDADLLERRGKTWSKVKYIFKGEKGRNQRTHAQQTAALKAQLPLPYGVTDRQRAQYTANVRLPAPRPWERAKTYNTRVMQSRTEQVAAENKKLYG